ncbi:hypothetical protein CEB3_c20910 [Peptococcaceae bacterium CEB3]|nr:hypothetical protein CEB3_c20910 [Peptococcaceae bacterium CEB3]
MDYILKVIVVIFMVLLITRLVMWAASHVQIVEFFEDFWRKIKRS